MNLDAFLEIESKYGLIEDQINGFHYWIYFRHVLHNELEAARAGHGEAHVRAALSSWQQLKARIGTLWYSVRYSRIPKGKHEILIFNHERRVWKEDSYECIYTDLIAEEYENSLVLERPYHQKHFRPVKTRNLMYTDYIEAVAMIYFYTKLYLCGKGEVKSLRGEIKERIQLPIEEICGTYGLSYTMDSILDKMVSGYYIYQIKKKAFKRLLERINPRVILEVVGYHMDCMVMNELALRFRIPTIELQHGMTGRVHTAYNYPKDIEIEQFPQYLFVFSSFWMEAARFPIPKERIREVGFPYLEKYAREVSRKTEKADKAIIIFISQSPIGIMLSDIAVRLQGIISQEKYKIIYKLHPGEYEGWRERYPALAGSGVCVVDNNHTDLYELFAVSSYQVGTFGSTATFEGLWFGLKTFIWKPEATPELELLCEKGIASFFMDGQELCRLIQEDNVSGGKSVFWKENALETMKREIDEIMAYQ